MKISDLLHACADRIANADLSTGAPLDITLTVNRGQRLPFNMKDVELLSQTDEVSNYSVPIPTLLIYVGRLMLNHYNSEKKKAR